LYCYFIALTFYNQVIGKSLEEVLFWNLCHSFNPNSFKQVSIKTPVDSNFLQL
jgi:hypothetical protein